MRTECKRPAQHEPTQENLTSLPQHQTAQKRWKLSRKNNQDPARRTRNTVIDMGYMLLLTQVKALYNGTGTEAFELDLRHDRSFTAVSMHLFCTPTLYLELECNWDLQCRVKVDFQDCEHKDQILSWLNSIYLLNEASQHEPLKGGVSAFFGRVKQLHAAQHFTLL